MKKSFMTRVLAMGLSLAMAFSLSVADVTTAEAATSPMESTKITITEGKTSSWVYLKNRRNSKYRIKSFKRTETAKQFITAKVGPKKLAVKATAKKDAVTNAGLEQKQVAMTINLVKKADVNKKNAKIVKTAKLNVVVKAKPVEKPAVAEITEATQKETKKVAVKFSTAVDSLKATDIAIVREEGTITIPVKKADLDADKLGATIETYTEMKDGKVYNVTYTAADEAKTKSTKSFTATDAKVAQLTLSTSTVVANESTEVKVKTLDANGVLLGTYKFSDLAQQKITVDVKCATGGYKDGDKIFLKNVGDTATVEATLHTYEFENGVEKDIIKNADTTVTAVADTYAGIEYNYTITDKSTVPAWDASTFKAVTSLPIDGNMYAHFYFKAGTTDKTSKFKIASADKSIVIIDEVKISKTTAPVIKGLKEGSTYLIVKDEKDNLVTTLPVTVQAARKATSLKLSANAVTVSKSTAQAPKWVEVKVYDQYDKEMTIDADSVAFEKLTVASSCAVLAVSGNGFKVTGAGMAKGTYYYEVKAKSNKVEVKNNLTVSVVDPEETTTEAYALELGKDTIDLTKDLDKTSEVYANVLQTIKVQKLQNGALVGYVGANSIASITVKGTNEEGSVDVTSNGATATDYSTSATGGCVASATMAAITGASSGSALKQEVKSGTYLVTAKIYTTDNTKVTTDISTTFVVKNDTTPRFGVAIKQTESKQCSTVTATGDQISTVISTAKNDMFAFTLDGAELDNVTDVDWAASEKKVTANQTYVGTVYIVYTVGTSKLYVPVKVDTTFTLND